MRNLAAASRYSKALLEISIEQGKVDSVSGDMKFFQEVLESSKEFELLLHSPVVRSDKKIEILTKVFEQFEELTMSFMKLLTNKRREDLLDEIAFTFEQQVKEYKGIVPVTLTTAQPLDEATKELIMSKVAPMINGKPEVTEKIDEEIIGGFVVRMGDTQIDASVESQLNNLKQHLTR
ncbi:MAG: ATP synthase F1 subunit delta [Crocinitomicaceae bacterium]